MDDNTTCLQSADNTKQVVWFCRYEKVETGFGDAPSGKSNRKVKNNLAKTNVTIERTKMKTSPDRTDKTPEVRGETETRRDETDILIEKKK